MNWQQKEKRINISIQPHCKTNEFIYMYRFVRWHLTITYIDKISTKVHVINNGKKMPYLHCTDICMYLLLAYSCVQMCSVISNYILSRKNVYLRKFRCKIANWGGRDTVKLTNLQRERVISSILFFFHSVRFFPKVK